MHLSQKIKKLRELRNYTQEYMANELGLSSTSYGKIERDETELSMARLQQIADVLQMKVEDVLSFDEKMVFNNLNNKVGSNVTNNFSDREIYVKHILILEEKIKQLEKELHQLKDDN
jgi:transcriptional regulator with XRE-family HTH domain